jgi:hypothetical protein
VLLVFSAGNIIAEMNDPTRPSGYQSVVSADEDINISGSLNLQAIYYHPDRPGALINGRRFSVGDRIGSSQITAIHADKIVLTDEGVDKEIRLVASSILNRDSPKASSGR